MAILDMFKKKSDSTTPTQPIDMASQQTPAQTNTQTVHTQTVQTSTQDAGHHMQSYSGIGNPPSGQAYSGIGNPPAPKVETASQQTSTQQTSNPTQIKPDDQQKQQEKLKEQLPDANQIKKNDDLGDNKQVQLDLMTHFTQRSNRVFVTAQNKAKAFECEFVDSEHLLHGLLSDPEIYKFFTDLKILPQIIEQELDKVYKKGSFKNQPSPSPRVKRILEQALIFARKLGYEFISPEHILSALYEEGEGAGARILSKLGLKKEQINKKITGKKEGLDKDGQEKSHKGSLDQFAIDLTAKAAAGQLDPVVERSEVIERVIHILSRRTKNNPALIGEAGVGKTAIAEGLAQKIVKKEVPDSLLNKKILQLDLMSMLAGASHRGDFEQRMKKLIEEIVASKGGVILFIDEIHNIVGAGAGGEGSLDASNFLKPSLARGELQVIGATTITEYRRYIEKDPALERRFQPVLVPEPTVEQSIKMLKSLRDKYEAFHRVKIPDDAIDAAAKLSKRYVGDRFLPDKAVDLIDEAGSAVRLPLISLPEEIRSTEERIAQLKQELQEAQKSGGRVKANILKPKVDDLEIQLKQKRDEYQAKKSQTTTTVTPFIIKDIISRWTGIPISKITESEVEKLTKLEDIMHKRLIDQEEAVEVVAQAVRRGRAGLKSSKRPIGSFVFLGPTGVGKTELAKTLAEVLFGQEEAMIRFDMTEYMEKHEVAKLLGAPPGYVGYEEGGKLTEAVRRRPYSVILFDEIEKAHPDIFNILLQILDDGRLTDNKGHVISFKETVVVCTSNIGTKTIQDEMIAKGQENIEEPTVLTTYTFSPRGREILTIIGKVFERDSKTVPWSNKMLIDYFSGQKIESSPNQTQDKTTAQFPGKQFDTHTISPKGMELISYEGKLLSRTSTTAKIWQQKSLIDYFKDNVVINALPDAPEQQLPTIRLKTHSFTQDEWEIISYQDHYWKRKSDSKDWQTGTLKEYFKQATIEQPIQNQKQIKQPQLNNQKNKINSTSFPTNYWDIHTFAPDGTEYIVVANNIWYKPAKTGVWKTSTLNQYFAKDFPLEKEIDEKKKVESELAKTQYDRIKAKVSEELRSFMRPELINRFDDVIIFEPLKYSHMLEICKLQLKKLSKLLEDQNIGFSWGPNVLKELVRQGFDPIYGARPLKRTIQKLIENPISSLIIEQKIKEGDMIFVDFDGDNIIFNIEKVKLVPESQLDRKGKRKFICRPNRHNFETEVVKNATIICPVDPKDSVDEVISKEEEKAAKKINANIQQNSREKTDMTSQNTNGAQKQNNQQQKNTIASTGQDNQRNIST